VAAAEAEEIATQRQDVFLAGVTAALASAGRRALGDFGPAREGLVRARRQADEVNQAYMSVLVGQIELETALDLGRFQRAADLGEGLARRLAAAGNHEQELRLAATMALVHGRLGHLPEAEAAAERAVAAAEQAQARGLEVRARLARAWLALQAARWDEARDEAGRAWAIATQIHAQALAAALHGLLGEVALSTGRGNPAAHYQAMRAIAEAIGAPALLAEALFGQAAAQPYAPAAPGLAERAKEVLEGLADQLPEADRAAFLAPCERKRIMEGNFIAFSLPVAKPGKPELRPPGLWRLDPP
jgi:hypothetical protein